MINELRSKNKSWQVGDTVNVGFMKNLKVTEILKIKDYMPDIYRLESQDGTKKYEFIPHNGLCRIN